MQEDDFGKEPVPMQRPAQRQLLLVGAADPPLLFHNPSVCSHHAFRLCQSFSCAETPTLLPPPRRGLC